MQMAIVEIVKHCGLKDANSSEFDPETKHAVIHILPEQGI